VFDIRPDRAESVASEYRVRAFHSLAELAESVEAASLAIPTVDHARVGTGLLERGLDLLVEKPIATTLAEADGLIAAARKRDRILQIGHLERFNPAVVAVRPLITRPLFFEVHRLGVFTERSLDVDVVFDVMIHDLDIVRALVNSPVRSVAAVGIPVISDKVDIANVRVEFENGCVANLTASRVSTEKVRKLRFFQPDEYISIDYTRRDVLVISVERAGAGFPKLHFRRLPTEPGEPLKAELEAFVKCVRTRTRPEVDGLQGRNALALAHGVMASIRQHAQRVQLGEGFTRTPHLGGQAPL
jgi:predicted dehydrogenase